MKAANIRLAIFPSPDGISLTNSPWSGIIKLFLARDSLVSEIPLGTGKSLTFFYSIRRPNPRSVAARSTVA
jgi:hypothetical protein